MAKKQSTDGYALSHTELQLRDADGHVLDGPGEGELHTRGPNTSVGLLDDPEREASIYLPDGWVRSGDLVSIDSDAYLTVVGRSKEIIIRGGVNIAPREVEDMIATFPEVASVAVVGLPDARLGERSCACVVLRPGSSLSLEDVSLRLRTAGLATYKHPEAISTFDALPMTPSGKIQKFELVRRIVTSQPSTREAG
jgi:non-ribosomal peptide synthetase component E (peptide arylation enzyme)